VTVILQIVDKLETNRRTQIVTVCAQTVRVELAVSACGSEPNR